MLYTTDTPNQRDQAVLLSKNTAQIGRPDNTRNIDEKSGGRNGTIKDLTQGFPPISLDDTNNLARMLCRVDNKYVLRRSELRAILDELLNDFAVLKINGVTEFKYSSCYFDDNFKSYYDHHQDRRLRFKVRTRHYIDSGETFFEVKLKDKRGKTNKQRMACEKLNVPQLDSDNLEMLKKSYKKLYKKDFAFNLDPSIIVNYTRSTLVSLHGGERVTIDYCLSFNSLTGKSVNIGDDFIIVETKSAGGKGTVDGLMKKAGIRQAKKLSKYCIGAILTGRVAKYNHFRKNIKRILENVVA